MINVSQINQIIVVLINFLGIVISLWIYLINPREKINQLFPVWVFFSILDVNFGYLADIHSLFQYSLIFERLKFSSVPFFMIAVYFFAFYFPQKGKRSLSLERTYVLIWLIIFYITLFTPLVIQKTIMQEKGIDVIFGNGILVHYFWSVFSIFFVLYILFSKYITLSLKDKLKTQYFLVGAFLYGLFNLIINIVYPIIKNSIKYHEIGDYAIVFPLLFTTYSIIKRELFEIKTILTEFLVGIMVIVLGTLPFAIEANFFTKVVLAVVFFVFLFIGHSLIKYARQRIKAEEVLEEKIGQRTKELEEAKSILEVKVKSRTKELEELTKSLEEKVKKRTGELQSRIEELEKFHKLTIGREVRMAELKEEIEEFKKEIERRKEK